MEFSTARCHIRAFREQDIESFMAYRNDLEWMQFQGFKGLTYEAYETSLIREPVLSEGAQLAIIHVDTGELIGDLYVLQEELTCWIGFTIAPDVSRQGYGNEVVSALTDQLQNKGVRKIFAAAHSDNLASNRLLIKLQFQRVEVTEEEYIYRLDM